MCQLRASTKRALKTNMCRQSNGTFVEFLPQGPRDGSALFLEAARHWDGVVVRAKAKDYLALRGAARSLHACLSPTDHPREVRDPAFVHSHHCCEAIVYKIDVRTGNRLRIAESILSATAFRIPLFIVAPRICRIVHAAFFLTIIQITTYTGR